MLLIAKLQKRTYTNNLLQFPAEMKTSGSKTPTAFISFHTNYDYQADYGFFVLFLAQ